MNAPVPIPDYNSFGEYVRLTLRVPNNLFQRWTLWNLKRHHLKARALSSVGTREDAVARLQKLNQYARTAHGDYREAIYDLKHQLLQVLYHSGFVTALTAEKQTLRCHQCTRGRWNYGRWNEAECYRCDGTGIYRVVRLLKFTVKAGDHEYVFHQPEYSAQWATPLVEFPYDTLDTDDLDEYKRFETPRVVISTTDLQRDMLILAYVISEWMWFHPVRVRSLSSAIDHDVRELWFKFPPTRDLSRAVAGFIHRNDDPLPF